jgi:hypothetical protein
VLRKNLQLRNAGQAFVIALLGAHGKRTASEIRNDPFKKGQTDMATS